MNISAKTRAYSVLSLIFILYMFDYADRLVITSFLDPIKSEWHVDDGQLGMLTSIVNLFVALFVFPFSILVDRWSRKWMIAIMGLFWSFASLSCAFATNYHQLLFFRALTGLGEAAYATAAVALISKVFPRNYRAQHIGIYNAAAPLGAGLGIMIGGHIAISYGWRFAFGLVAFPGMLLAMLFLFINDYKTLPLKHQGGAHSKNPFVELAVSIRNILAIPTLWYVYVAYAIVIGVNTAVIDWLTTYYVRYYHMAQSKASMIAGATAVLVLVGAPLGGFVGDAWNKRNKNAYLYFSAITTFACALSLGVAIYTTDLRICILFTALFGITSLAFLAPATTVIQNVVQPGLRAVAYGYNVLFENLLGAFLFPVLVGKLSDVIGLKSSLMTLPFVAILSAVIFLVSTRRYQKDLHTM